MGLTVDEVLEAARKLAREAGHPRVTDAHVVLALSSRSGIKDHLARRWLSVARIDDWARASAANDGVRGYRESAEPAIPSELRATLEDARPRSILGRFLKPTVNDMINALIARNGPARFEWDAAPVRRLYGAAARIAKAARHRAPLVEHAFAALAENDERFITACSALGVPRDAFHGDTESALLAPIEQLITFASLKATLAGRRELGVDLVVVDLLRNASADDLLFAYIHGSVRSEIPSIPGPAEVVIYNDDVTTMVEVVRALEHRFGLETSEALALMHAVHTNGSATFGEDGRDAAIAMEACRKEIPTLRLELRASSHP